MPSKKHEPNWKEVAKHWLAGWIWRDAPKVSVECHLCHGFIRGGTRVYRYITGFYNGNPRLAYVCEKCGRELVEFMIERLKKLLEEEE